MKTVFIIITRGFIIRNILRSGILDFLINEKIRVVLLFANVKNLSLPLSVYEDFSHPQIIIEVLSPDKNIYSLKDNLYSLFKKMAAYLVYSDSTRIYSQSGNKRKLSRHIFWAHLERFVYTPLSKLDFLKSFVRYIEQKLFREGIYASYFETYKPDIVFSTSIVSKQDIEFMKEAKHRGVVTISMCKGWDNITKILLRVLPDVMIMQNSLLKDDMVRTQLITEEKIKVCGFPQFDWYRKSEIILSREDFFGQLGLSSARKLIFFGSEGCWAPEDDKIADVLVKLINDERALIKKCSLLIRPHFSDINNRRFERFKNLPNVKLDDNYNFSEFFLDNWNPDTRETEFFVNCIYHCDLMITAASTLVLDATCLDKPSIGISYNVLRHPVTNEDLSYQLYQTDHFQHVLKNKAIDLVSSDEDLRKSINNSLEFPQRKHQERNNLLEKLCFKVDGASSKRIAEVIINKLYV